MKMPIDAILKAMQTYGGSFVSCLAELYPLADAENRRILENGFRHYFEEYDAIAFHVAEQRKKEPS